jgi:hypothetical protein
MDVIIHIIYNLPSVFKNTKEIILNELEEDNIPLEKIKEQLQMKFERLINTTFKSEKTLISLGK